MGRVRSTHGDYTRLSFVGNHQEKVQLGNSRCGWEDNIKMDLLKRCECVDWLQLVQDMQYRTFVNNVTNIINNYTCQIRFSNMEFGGCFLGMTWAHYITA
jgi:hypothetical protein